MEVNGQASMTIIREKSTLREQPRLKAKGRWRLGLALAAAIAVGGVVMNRTQQTQQAIAPTPVPNSKPVLTVVTALGRLEPKGEVVTLSGPSSAQGARVERILIKEGERVKAGEIIAILDNNSRLEAALDVAKGEVQVASANLAVVKAGAKTGEINAQKALIARLEAELLGQKETLQATVARTQAEQRTAEADIERYETLYKEGAVSIQERDSRRLTASTTREQVNESQSTLKERVSSLQRQVDEARANLDRITEIRPTEVLVAQATVDSKLAAVKQATAELTLTYVKAPIAGEIIEIHTQPGETISEDGIAEIGRTEQMIVVAEVIEDDISKVRLGQRATITSENESFTGKLQGTVTEIAKKVDKQDVLDSDPAADVDARVVEVRIGLPPEASQRVSGLTYANVVANINI